MKTNQVTVNLDDESEMPVVNDTLVLDERGNASLDTVVDEDGDDGRSLPKNAVLNADGTVTLTLLYPRTLKVKSAGVVRDEEYAKLTFHRLNGADMRAISSSSNESRVLVSFSKSTKIKQAVMNHLFDLMDGADIQASGEVIEYFFESGRKTGR
ncbi:hypothetical protein [Microvirga terricola]|uniref:Uncharacterized protein n=1 Tax=Microvirga terricola TaxID=2719797 RepID=A0ABX0V6C5_9HYPH|nr:hypothetical protein [Microvirga terricola]NIX75385.1 hypothetical protein [Microvirga terricola]